MIYWCSYPGCGCTAKFEHGGYFGWYFKCRIHARLMGSMDYVFPIGTFAHAHTQKAAACAYCEAGMQKVKEDLHYDAATNSSHQCTSQGK